MTQQKPHWLYTCLCNNSENNLRQRYGVGVDEEYKKVAKRTLWRMVIVKCRMWYADIRGHHGMKWNYEPGDHYMRGSNHRKSRKY